jgi:hypothetical protein
MLASVIKHFFRALAFLRPFCIRSGYDVCLMLDIFLSHNQCPSYHFFHVSWLILKTVYITKRFCKRYGNMKFEVLTVLNINITALWDDTLQFAVKRFGGTYFVRFYPEDCILNGRNNANLRVSGFGRVVHRLTHGRGQSRECFAAYGAADEPKCRG